MSLVRRSSFRLPHGAAGLWLAFAGMLAGADWPQFLGPHRNGAADASEPALPESFPTEPKTLWKKELGTGFAGPVVRDGKVIMFHREGDEAVVEALETTDGSRAWRFSYPSNYADSFGFDNGPRATPTLHNGRVFTHGAEGMVHALDFKTGALLWKYDTVSDLQSPQGFFGRAGAPLVTDGKVIITAGGSNSRGPAGVIALDESTGKLVWQSVDDEASYSSPVAYGPPDNRRLLCWMRNELWSLDAATGKVRHHQRLRSGMDASVNAATPIPVGEGDFFLSAGYGVGGTIWSLEPDDSPFAPAKLGEDLLESHYSTAVFLDYHLYGFHGRQETGQNLRCVDLNEGKVSWESPRVPGGTLLLVHDKLLVVTELGELWIVRATPDKFQQLSVSQILRAGHRSYPAYANGLLFARDGEKLVAVRVR